jgi:inorganic pyrophosphatase
MTTQAKSGIAKLPAFNDDGSVNAVIEAVRDTRNKFKYDPSLGLFIHDNALAPGETYPFDFGFIPSTTADDGDPIDVLVLMDEPAFVGAVVPARLVGVIEATQSEKDSEPVRNDRLLAVARKSHIYRDAKALNDLPTALVEEVEHFWVTYNQLKGREFTPIGRGGQIKAKHLVERAMA